MKIKNIFIIAAILIMSVPFLQSCDDESTSKLSFEIICEDTIAPCIVHLKNTSIGYDNFFWEFGDGSTSEEKNPTHEYETDSTYEVILRDKDNNANYVKKTFKVYDYRDKWVGDWYFMSIHSVWNFEQIFVIEGTDTTVTDVPPENDTTFYNGHIFLGEEGNTVFLNHRENVNRKILVDTSGRIYHNDNLWKYYYNEGNFFGNDSIFYKFGEGGRGGGSNLYVYGKKQ